MSAVPPAERQQQTRLSSLPPEARRARRSKPPGFKRPAAPTLPLAAPPSGSSLPSRVPQQRSSARHVDLQDGLVENRSAVNSASLPVSEVIDLTQDTSSSDDLPDYEDEPELGKNVRGESWENAIEGSLPSLSFAGPFSVGHSLRPSLRASGRSPSRSSVSKYGEDPTHLRHWASQQSIGATSPSRLAANVQDFTPTPRRSTARPSSITQPRGPSNADRVVEVERTSSSQMIPGLPHSANGSELVNSLQSSGHGDSQSSPRRNLTDTQKYARRENAKRLLKKRGISSGYLKTHQPGQWRSLCSLPMQLQEYRVREIAKDQQAEQRRQDDQRTDVLSDQGVSENVSTERRSLLQETAADLHGANSKESAASTGDEPPPKKKRKASMVSAEKNTPHPRTPEPARVEKPRFIFPPLESSSPPAKSPLERSPDRQEEIPAPGTGSHIRAALGGPAVGTLEASSRLARPSLIVSETGASVSGAVCGAEQQQAGAVLAQHEQNSSPEHDSSGSTESAAARETIAANSKHPSPETQQLPTTTPRLESEPRHTVVTPPTSQRAYMQSVAERLRQERLKHFDSAVLDAHIYVQPGRQPPPDVQIPLQALQSAIYLPSWADREPDLCSFIQGMHPILDLEQQARKDAEIAARGGRKVWFGKVAARLRFRINEDLKTPKWLRPRVVLRLRDISFYEENELPLCVRSHPGWMAYYQWHRKARERALAAAIEMYPTPPC